METKITNSHHIKVEGNHSTEAAIASSTFPTKRVAVVISYVDAANNWQSAIINSTNIDTIKDISEVLSELHKQIVELNNTIRE